MGYFAYLISGRNYFLEETQFLAATHFLKNTDSNRRYTDGVLLTNAGSNTKRGAAWSLRTLAQAAALTPDGDQLKTELTNSLNKNIEYYYNAYRGTPHNSLGFVAPYSNYNGTTSPYSEAIWQEDFFTMAFGYMRDLQSYGAAYEDELLDFSDWKYGAVVGRLGGSGNDQFSYRYAGQYALNVAPLASSDWSGAGPWYNSWGEIARSMNLPTTGDLGQSLVDGYPESATGYVSNMLPALAYAVEHGAPGAADAWNRFTSASNFNSHMATYTADPVWSVYPREINNMPPPPPPPPVPMVPSVTIAANPTTTILGESTTLSWTSTDATACTASNGWSGTKSTSGSQSISPTTNTTYTLTCTGAGGSANQSVTVVVTTVPTPPTPPSTGTSTLPTWVSSLPLWQWYEIPNTALSSVAPAVRPLGINGPVSKITTWNGAALRRSGSVYMLGAAGGHADYAGNEVNAIELNTDNPRWVELKSPTPNSEIIDAAQFYKDLRPASTHTYYNTQYIDQRDRMLVFASPGLSGPTTFPAPPADWPYMGSNRSFSFNYTTKDWDSPDYIALYTGGGDFTAGLAVKHQTTGDVYLARSGSTWWRWNQSSNTWTNLGGYGESNYAGAAIDPTRNRMLIVGDYSGLSAPRVRNLSGNPVSVSFGGLGADILKMAGYPGVVYDEANDTYLVFKNDSSGITTYRVNANTFAVDAPTVSGTLPAQRTNGIQNAIQYVPELGGVVIANSYTGNVKFMRTASLGTTVPTPPTPPAPLPLPVVALSVSPTSITKGESVTLSWNSAHAVLCTAGGGWSGKKAGTGTEVVTPVSTTTYALICTNTQDVSVEQQVTVGVRVPASGGGGGGGGGGSGSKKPTITMTAEPLTVVTGNTSRITWKTKNATKCAASWKSSVPTSGSYTTQALERSTSYTLTCTGSAGKVTESLTIGVVRLATLAEAQSLSSITPEAGSTGGGGGTYTTSPFTRDLILGDVGEDVRALQKFLNAQGFLVASTLEGSPGQETTRFGPGTARALARFQERYASEILTPSGFTAGTGQFGPSTRRKVEALSVSTGGSSSTSSAEIVTLIQSLLAQIQVLQAELVKIRGGG
jgi:hypothetical protein